MSTAEHSMRVSKKFLYFFIRSNQLICIDAIIYLYINIYLLIIYFIGSRATSVFRFGFISLDLISIVLQDSGEYLCRVVSSTGIAESRATLSVTGE